MSILKEFKDFAMRGNVVDMAVGIIIGAAFGKIISSLVNDVIMPPIGLLLGGVDFSNLAINIKDDPVTNSIVAIKYGVFINNVIDFLIIAFAIFLMVKIINKLKRKQEETVVKEVEPHKEEILLTEIRDILKKQAVK